MEERQTVFESLYASCMITLRKLIQQSFAFGSIKENFCSISNFNSHFYFVQFIKLSISSLSATKLISILCARLR